MYTRCIHYRVQRVNNIHHPFGRYEFNKLPFGISSAPEHFQRRVSKVLEGLPGIVCHIDDVLVYGKDEGEHDSRLRAALEREGLTLNINKCKFRQSSITFLGHVIDSNGIRPDPRKTEAIREMKTPSSVTELRRFLGMINQMNKFSPNIANILNH